MTYLLIKAVHIAAVLIWIGGLILLCVAQAAIAHSSAPALPQERRWLIAVARWERIVTTPALLLVWIVGITLAMRGGWYNAQWFLVKLGLVIFLSGLHGVLAGYLHRSSYGATRAAPPFVKYAAGTVIACTTGIALLVVCKPQFF